MTELKTLKDIEKTAEAIYTEINPVKTEVFDIFNNIRQEAIKDLKEIFRQKLNQAYTPGRCSYYINIGTVPQMIDGCEISDETRFVVGYIKWKFNISEKELKNIFREIDTECMKRQQNKYCNKKEELE